VLGGVEESAVQCGDWRVLGSVEEKLLDSVEERVLDCVEERVLDCFEESVMNCVANLFVTDILA
jgi:hypothetical protein